MFGDSALPTRCFTANLGDGHGALHRVFAFECSGCVRTGWTQDYLECEFRTSDGQSLLDQGARKIGSSDGTAQGTVLLHDLELGPQNQGECHDFRLRFTVPMEIGRFLRRRGRNFQWMNAKTYHGF